MKRIVLGILLSCLAFSAMAKEYTLGVVPQQSPVKMFKSWKPIVDYLSETTGFKISLRTEKSIAEFENVLYDGGYDLAYMNPFHYTIANQQQQYEAMVRAARNIKGILVMKKDQPDLEALIKDDATQFLFPSPNAFAATLLIKYELLTKFGVDLTKTENFKYVNSHDSVYMGVARNLGQLGGGIQRTFNNFKSGADKERIAEVYQTAPYPSHPIAVKPSMPKEDCAKIVQALLDMPVELMDLLSVKKIIATNDDEFSVIRELSQKLDIVVRKRD